MLSYELSEEADKDLEDIFNYTIEKYGIHQAKIYLNKIDSALSKLGNNPGIGRERPEVRHGLRSLLVENYTIFYRVLADRLRIVRVLHSRRDIIKLFE